jgi:hypothetical protein
VNRLAAGLPTAAAELAPRTEVDGPSILLRRRTLQLAALCILLAGGVVVATGIRTASSGLAQFAGIAALQLIVSMLFDRKARFSRHADLLGTMVLVWASGMICGLISLSGLRLHFPLVDRQLLLLDHFLGIDTVGVVRWLSNLPRWVMLTMEGAYHSTIPMVLAGLILLSVLGDRIEAWRAAFCFVGSVLSVCILSIFTPAKGIGLWLADADFRRLPDDAVRYFWSTFDTFYSGKDPVLSIGAVDGVVSFPSFHMAMCLIVLAMWRTRLPALALVTLWAIPMLGATLAIGGHYVVDLIGGALVWAGWYTVSFQLTRKGTIASAGSNSAIVR